MSHWKLRTLALRLALPALLLGGGGVGATLLTPPASAAALPESATSCSGSLTSDPTGKSVDEPDLTDYSFYCDGGITAYSVTVDKVRSDGHNIDDYNPNPLVYSAGSDLQTVSPTESVNCGGSSPSNGIDCYSLVGSTAGFIAPGDTIVGSVDLTSQYCASLPKGAKPGTPAVPRATVELIVTDSTGAEDGPFELRPTTACKSVPAVVPAAGTTATKRRTATRPSAVRRPAGRTAAQR